MDCESLDSWGASERGAPSLQVLTEEIEKQCLNSDGNLVDLVINDTKAHAPVYEKLLGVVPANGRRDMYDALWMSRDNCLVCRMEMLEKNDLTLDIAKKIMATVTIEWYLGKDKPKMACLADKRFAKESMMIFYDSACNERFIKSYSNGSYKSESALMKEFREEISRQGWV